jgi:hypothetical protein
LQRLIFSTFVTCLPSMSEVLSGVLATLYSILHADLTIHLFLYLSIYKI